MPMDESSDADSHHHGQRGARPLAAVVEESHAERMGDVERLVRARHRDDHQAVKARAQRLGAKPP